MSFERLASQAERYYSEKFADHGATARGVDWNSEQSQELRFEQLLKIVDRPADPFSVLDYGCGYGALADFILARGLPATYVGFDLSLPMIDHATAHHQRGARFTADESELRPADYAVASGLMNVKQSEPEDAWRDYCFEVIGRLSSLSGRGFAFNMLTSYSDPERKRPDLYYADPLFFFDYCKRHQSRHVALLHDYGLYEFTLLVRKEPL